MKLIPKIGLATAALLSLTIVTVPTVASAATGIHVSGRNIVESNGNSFVMRGTSHPHAWYSSQTGAFADIKSLGANTVRVVLSGGRWTTNSASDVSNVVSLCKSSKLICVLEDHDTTGYGEASGAYSLSQAADYWISVKSALQGQENYILVNIGNEPYGNNNTANWTADTKNAITKLRNAGIANALVVDAPNWGQDNNGVMAANASSVESSDSARNTIFSVHMYSHFSSASTITSYVSTFKNNNLPLIIGEFAPYDPYGDVDEDTLMSTAQSQSVGYLGWSWSGNSSDISYMDQVNSFDKNSLTSWGSRLFNGTNGIKATAKQATVY
ncbi:glycoside hydrolase family 5 protein [Actinophytocola sp.]|uniref:glycoside hydrolase family 5 protein n=1 Tax=Actinophytocola sp. TaxID=1872138 RepID=UPI00389AD36B